MRDDSYMGNTIIAEPSWSVRDKAAKAVSLSWGKSFEQGTHSLPLRVVLATILLLVTASGFPPLLFGQTTVQQAPNPALPAPKTTVPSAVPNPLTNPSTPTPPRLVFPNDVSGVTTQTRGGKPPAVLFRWQWQSNPSLLAPTSFTLCLTEAGQPCNAPSATLVRNIPLTVFEHRMAGLPRAFEGKQFLWSVGICTFGGDCTFSIARRFSWNAPPSAPPDLVGHAPVTADKLLGFQLAWNHPGGSGITYRICFRHPGTLCPSGNSVVIDTQQRKAHSITPQDMVARGYDRFAGAPETQWTAAACNSAGCNWAGTYGVLRIPPKPGHPYISPRANFPGQPVLMSRDPGYIDFDGKPLEPPMWTNTPNTLTGATYASGLRSFGTCLIFEGSPLEPNNMRNATRDLCGGLADIMPKSAQNYTVKQINPVIGTCKPLGYLKRGYYRAFAQACYEFWGCILDETGERFMVELTQYDQIDLQKCFSASLR